MRAKKHDDDMLRAELKKVRKEKHNLSLIISRSEFKTSGELGRLDETRGIMLDIISQLNYSLVGKEKHLRIIDCAIKMTEYPEFWRKVKLESISDIITMLDFASNSKESFDKFTLKYRI